MKKIVVSGSSKLQKELMTLLNELRGKYEVLNYPKSIKVQDFMAVYPEVHKNFYESIAKTDVFLLFNEDKNGIGGYIGSAGFAELSFAIAQNQVYNKAIEVYIYKHPSKQVHSYDEIKLYLQLGWIKIWEK